MIDDLSNLEVPSNVWFSTYSEEMKKQHLSKVLSADLSKVTCLTSNLNMPLEDHDKMDDTSSHSPNAINPTIPLSIPYTVLSQIENIHIHEKTLTSMWKKAGWLCNMSNMITKASGNGSPYAQLIASNTNAAPHFVSVPKTFTGQYLRDSQCPMFKVYNIQYVLIVWQQQKIVENFRIFYYGSV